MNGFSAIISDMNFFEYDLLGESYKQEGYQ